MINKDKGFRIFVISFVTLIGMGFGALAGVEYSDLYWWIAAIVGAVSGYLLAELYLKQLMKISAIGYSKMIIWLWGTLVAIICGIICTTLVHAVMAGMAMTILPMGTESRDLYILNGIDIFLIAITIAEIIGFCAGFVAGGICSLIYVLAIKDKSNAVS